VLNYFSFLQLLLLIKELQRKNKCQITMISCSTTSSLTIITVVHDIAIVAMKHSSNPYFKSVCSTMGTEPEERDCSQKYAIIYALRTITPQKLQKNIFHCFETRNLALSTLEL